MTGDGRAADHPVRKRDGHHHHVAQSKAGAKKADEAKNKRRFSLNESQDGQETLVYKVKNDNGEENTERQPAECDISFWHSSIFSLKLAFSCLSFARRQYSAASGNIRWR